MDEKTFQERVVTCARRYLTDICELTLLEDLEDANGNLNGFIARDRDGDFRFVYLSHQTIDSLQHWCADSSNRGEREQFERDMLEFFSKGEPQTGRVSYTELRVLVLENDRAILKMMTSEPECVQEV